MWTASQRGRWCTLLCVLLLGLFLLRTGVSPGPGPNGGPPQPAAAHQRVVSKPSAAGPLPHSPPLRISLPSIRVDAPLARVGLDQHGSIITPPLSRPDLAGWYTGAVAPGERGTSVVVGHLDNTAGPAVFYLLGALAPGSRVEILRKDGRTAVFETYGTETHRQRDFPAERVYADGPRAELRLITCGGRYSERDGYEENVVVFARLVDVR
ncbi:class F sortase [Streptomyces albipurpureus]|uniref:Class F sortase n=1 Tax=Streptomyces albipurpureus TaxID=2897419 RepID=A0ABT0URF9_9ACTN|nr:class F sortase [Streptomyces sp. CWNU-1]MCM2390680.1 class F sortase [Streptomyces sp. CWNU-1]